MARVKIGNVYPPDDYLMARCAPSGYGLGRATARLVDTPDEATNNGFYCVGNDAYTGDGTTNDWRLGWCMLLVERRADTIYQTAKYLDIEWRRNKKNADTEWSPWEWVNPPMLPGEEYRTTERWNGKPVYRALLSLGYPTQSPTASSTSIKAKAVVRSHGHMDGNNLPIIDGTLNGAKSAWINTMVNSDGNIATEIYFGSSMTGKGVTLQVWYTKD